MSVVLDHGGDFNGAFMRYLERHIFSKRVPSLRDKMATLNVTEHRAGPCSPHRLGSARPKEEVR